MVAGVARRRKVRFSAALLTGALLLAVAAKADEPSPPRSVLVLYGFDPFAPAVTTFDAGLRSALFAEFPDGVTLHNEVLDLDALGDPLLAPTQRAWFQARYGAHRPEVVVAVGEEALDFALAERAELWPEGAIVFSGVDAAVVARMQLPAGVTGVARRPAVGQTLELALELLPDTRRVVFFGGSAVVDRSLADAARPELVRVAGGLEILDFTGLALAELDDRLAALPEHSIVFGVSLFRDATLRSLRGSEALRALARRSRAPIFTTHAHLLGLGVVGGWVTDYNELGAETGQLLAAVLRRAPGAGLPSPTVTPARPIVDERQLDRWHIPERRLPPGTEVLFGEVSVWRLYGWTIAGVLGALFLESALIAFLLFERRRRRAAEAEARANQERIAHINRVGTIAELSGSLAHELNGPLGAIANNARAARKYLLAEAPDLKEVRASLVDIESSAERAGQVIGRLRSVLRKDEFKPAPVDVRSVVQDAVRLVRSEATRRRATIDVAPSSKLPSVKGDEVLLLQVLLNLLLNALDAVAVRPVGERRIGVACVERGGAVEVSVADSGVGIPPSALEGLFEPFFTTKPQGLGMGLAICRSIAEAHGGSIRAENRPEGGAVLRVTLPALAVGQEVAA